MDRPLHASRRTPGNAYWYRMRHNQMPTILSLLTPEYQKRMVQKAYHEGDTNARTGRRSTAGPKASCAAGTSSPTWEWDIMVTPSLVQILAGVARNFITNIHVGREFNMDGAVPRLGADVPRWYGETIGFWDKDALITWTSNIQGWMVHGAFEYSNKMQTIEIYTPNRDASGKFLGLNHEAIFYDPEALVEPVRIIRNYVKTSGFEEGDPYVFIDCVQTIFPMNGKATPVSPGTVIRIPRCPTCTAAPGRRSGSSTTSRAWRSRKPRTSSASSKVGRPEARWNGSLPKSGDGEDS